MDMDADGLAGLDVIVDDPEEGARLDPVTGALEIPTDDGGVIINFNPPKDDEDEADDQFGANLVEKMEPAALETLTAELLDGIAADESSRSEWLQTRAAGIDLLGLTIEKPTDDVGGMGGSISKVRSPLLLEAVLRAQATAASELLPASGPVKVRTDGAQTAAKDQMAEALERDMNHFLTVTASEYYPDTNRGLFWSSFGGCFFKKVYSCPVRRRPVSETVDAKHIIVSDATSDLANAGRVTHEIEMRPSMMRRMMLLGVYRDVDLQPPPQPEQNAVDVKEETVAGVRPAHDRPEDEPYTVYECYCDLDLEEFAPPQFKGEGVALPYKVVIEKDSRVILEIRRNWEEDDEQCLPRECLVKFPYVEAMGLYGIGLLQIMGNNTTAHQGATRLMLDSGMINNYPGGLIDAAATKQKTSNIQVPVGAFAPIQLGGRDIREVAMATPSKPLDPSFMAFIKQLEEGTRRLGGSAEVPVGEGKQDAPVGTTLAMIEQATKIESAVHKGLHAAQAKEFQLLKARFREDPEAFWRNNRHPTIPWDEGKLLAALNDYSIVPVSDPNTPSHIHRLMKVMGLKQVAATNPDIDRNEVDKEALTALGYEDVQRFFKPPAPPMMGPSPEDKMADATLIQAQAKAKEVEQKPILELLKGAQKDKEIKSKERVEAMKVGATVAIHPDSAPLVQRTIRNNTAPQT